MIKLNVWTLYPYTKIIFAKLFDVLGMRNLLFSSLNIARTVAAYIHIMNPLKWIFSFSLHLGSIYSPFQAFLNSPNSCHKRSGSWLYPFSKFKNKILKKSYFFLTLIYTHTYTEPSRMNIFIFCAFFFGLFLAKLKWDFSYIQFAYRILY